MGNTASVNLEEDTKRLEITEKLVRDFQYHINLVDHSMTGFARSIDSLRTSCATLQQCRNENKDSNLKDTSVGEDEDVIESTSTQDTLLLETIDEVVSDHKFVVMESLSRLFSFIGEIGDSCNIPKPDTKFSIDKYRDKSNVTHLGKDVHYCDARFESMQKELKAVNTAYQIAKNDVENFNSREEIYQKERLLLKNKIKDLETQVAHMKIEIEELIKQKNVLEVEKEECSRELYTLKENDKQIKLDLSSEISSKKKIEEKSKAEIDDCFKQIETHEREKEQRLATIDDLQREINSLKKKNENVCTDLMNERHMITTLKEQNTSKINSLNIEIDRLTTESIYVKQLHECEIKRLETLLEKEQEKHRDEIDKLRMESEKLIQDKQEKETEMNEKVSKTDLLISEAITKIHIKDEQLSTSICMLNNEVKKMNIEHSDVKKLYQTEVQRLTECFEQAKLQEKEYVKTLNDLKEKLQHCNEEKGTSQMLVCQLEKEINRLTTDVKDKETALEKAEQIHKDEIGIGQNKIKKLKQKKLEQSETIENLKSDIQSLTCTKIELSSQLQAEINTRVSLIENKVSIIKSLQDEISKMTQEYAEVKEMHTKEKQALEEATEKEIRQKGVLEEKIKDLKEEQRRNGEDIKQLNVEKENLKSDIKIKQQLIESLEINLELASRKEIYVQVIHISGFRSSKMEGELKRMLKMRMIPERIDLQFLDCSDSYILKSDLPLLIVCSRNYSLNRDRNISSVTNGRKETHKQRALLMFHDKDEKTFQREVTRGSFTDNTLCGIFDIGHNKEALFKCEINSKNIENILQFIMQKPVNVESATNTKEKIGCQSFTWLSFIFSVAIEMESNNDNMQKAGTDREKMDTFLEQCHEKMKYVDKSAASLMNSLDLLHATTEMFVHQLDSKFVHGGEPPKVEMQNLQECKRTAREIIMTLEGTVLHHKVTTIESLRSFLHFIMKNAEENVETRTLSSCYLLLDAEYSNVSNKHKEKNIQRLLNENDEMRKEINEFKELIKLSDNKEKTFLEEKKSQNRKIRSLEAELEQTREEHVSNLSKQSEEIESLKEKLSVEADKVQASKKQYNELIGNLETLQAKHREETQSYEEKKQSSRNEIESLQQHTAQQRESIESLQTQNAQLSKNNEELQSQMAELREHKEKLQTETAKQRESIESLQTQTAQLTENNIELQNQKAQLNEDKKQIETDLEASRHENKQKEDELIKMNIKFDKANEEYSIQKTEIENEREAVRNKCIELTRENDSVSNDRNRMNQLNQDLQKKIDELQNTVQTKEQEYDCLQKSENHLKETFENEKKSLNDINYKLETETLSLKNKLTETENEKRSLNDQIETSRSDFNKQIKEKDESIKNLTFYKNVLEEDLRTSQSALEASRNKYGKLSEDFETEKIKLFTELEEKQKHIDRVDIIVQDREKALTSIELEKQNLLQQREKLSANFDEMTKKTNQERESLEMKLRNAEKDMNLLRQEMRKDKTTYESEIYQKETKIKEFSRKNKQIYEEKENVSKVLVAVEEELERIKSKRVLQVQLYSQNRTSLTGIVEKGLTELLTEKLESEKLELEFVQCAKASDIQPDVPVLLLCITVSRLGTDVANAVQGLTLSPEMAVLIFHHKDVHALPNQDSGRVLTGHDLKTLGGVFDMAFLSGKGIYPCEMNNNNAISLVNFINRKGVRRPINQA
ncbi:protein Daple-like [Mercenaria mercenaria]|uniref:protein Daple-like n=1 Tax=Mercenaria mercenaria TaxID=6596 RepID=UPI00234F90FC|nr:protein Daple-like [Mercenaria mercenaria]